MVQQSLTEYINKLLTAGYDVGTIRTTLLNAGYSPAEINQALTYLKKPTRKVSLNLKVILIAVSALILVILLILGGVKLFTPEAKTIDFRLSPIQTEIASGGQLSFLTSFTSNTDAKENVQMNYEIINTQTNDLTASKQETITIGERAGLTKQIAIPLSADAGSYELKATMQHKDQKQLQRIRFLIIEAETETEKIPETFEEQLIIEKVECPESCDDFNPCTTDYCDKGLCRHNPISPCCGNGACESGETTTNCKEDCVKTAKSPMELIEQAKIVSKSDPEAASALCNQLIQSSDMDLCFIEIAYTSGKSVICESITTSGSKDSCYMNFALDGDYSVCSKVMNGYLSKSCNSLARSNAILEQVQQLE
ncbi:hypothetical protein KY333_03800 [Candidatus Woesearchaeota archaeon]|nr:hypothetical protein [Candidatus Woesearchaeota archaeon]